MKKKESEKNFQYKKSNLKNMNNSSGNQNGNPGPTHSNRLTPVG